MLLGLWDPLGSSSKLTPSLASECSWQEDSNPQHLDLHRAAGVSSSYSSSVLPKMSDPRDKKSRCFFMSQSEKHYHLLKRACQVALVIKNPPANAGDLRDSGSIPGLGRSPGGGHGNPFQHSCLENPKSLVGYSPQCRKESDKTEATQYTHKEK